MIPTDTDCVSEAAEEALVSNLQAQIAAIGCSDLQQYARRLRLLASRKKSGTPSPALTTLKHPTHTRPFQTASSPNRQPPSFQFQSDFCCPTVAASPVQNANSLWSVTQPGNFHPQSSAEEPNFSGMHTEYYSASAQSAARGSLPPMSPAPAFPAWSGFSASPDSACSSNFPFFDTISHHFPAADNAALELQARLAQLCQSAAGVVQQRQAESRGHHSPGMPLHLRSSKQQAMYELSTVCKHPYLLCQCLLV